MPLYEYECETNGHRFEVIQKFSDPPVATCRTCGAPVHKLLSSPAIQFKGSGWYITDYARAGKSDGGNGQPAKSGTASADSAPGKSDTASSDAAAAKSESKAETKSDAKTDSKNNSQFKSQNSQTGTGA